MKITCLDQDGKRQFRRSYDIDRIAVDLPNNADFLALQRELRSHENDDSIHAINSDISHDDLKNIQIADQNIYFGHVTNSTQSIYGDKTFYGRTYLADGFETYGTTCIIAPEGDVYGHEANGAQGLEISNNLDFVTAPLLLLTAGLVDAGLGSGENTLFATFITYTVTGAGYDGNTYHFKIDTNDPMTYSAIGTYHYGVFASITTVADNAICFYGNANGGYSLYGANGNIYNNGDVDITGVYKISGVTISGGDVFTMLDNTFLSNNYFQGVSASTFIVSDITTTNISTSYFNTTHITTSNILSTNSSITYQSSSSVKTTYVSTAYISSTNMLTTYLTSTNVYTTYITATNIYTSKLTATSNVSVSGMATIASARFGTASDYSKFEADGTYMMVGDSTVYNDLQFAISSGKVGTSNYPSWSTFNTNFSEYTFNEDDYIDLGSQELPHDWQQGGTIEFHIHWANNSRMVGGTHMVVWQLQYTNANNTSNGETTGTSITFTPTTTISASFTPELGYTFATLTHVYTSIGTATMTNMLIGSQIKMRLKRLTCDPTYTAPAKDPFALQVGIHYKADTIGSRSISTK